MNAARRLPETNRYLDQVPATPLVPVRLDAGGPTIWCKLEFLNPSGSTKDRIAGYILQKAARAGAVAPGGLVVEASSGSTSIAMALASAQLGLRFVAVMPEGVSNERRLMIEAYGGEVVFSPRDAGMQGALAVAADTARGRGGFQPLQFDNPDNPAAHRMYTASEVLAQIPGGWVDAVVSGVGTGGTLAGLFEGLSDHGCSPLAFAARPSTAAGVGGAGAECCSLSARIPGVGGGFSSIYARFKAERGEWLEEVHVPDDESIETTRRLIRAGFPAGPSSGLNYRAAATVAARLGPDARVVTVFPDRMERYFSTELFRRPGTVGAGIP